MSQFIVSKEIEFDAGHRVPLHSSKCSNPHGHRYKVVAHVAGYLHERGSSTGMVMDFSDIKLALTELVHDLFDHGFIVQRSDIDMMDALQINIAHGQTPDTSLQGWKVIVVDWTPTAEEMARAVFEILRRRVSGLVAVDIYETPTSKATYPFWDIRRDGSPSLASMMQP
jgi:6-pyruvoyltetrahydropterin/6-carboxytetrahydropterin synthase